MTFCILGGEDNTMQAVTQYLKQRGYQLVNDSWYSRIELYKKWYNGFVPSVHKYRQFNGKKYVRRERKSLRMAKTISEDWASLLMNEKVEIVLSDENAQKKLDAVLENNKFRKNANKLVELTFALGTGAFVEYREKDKTTIDYIRAGMIYPLKVRSGEIVECAFASEFIEKTEKHIYLNMHILDEHGEYVVENHLFRNNGGSLTEIDLPDGVEPTVHTRSAVPKFQIIKPNIVNNVELDNPMGIPVFENGTDQLQAVDLIFDSYCNEFQLGKKRITVPISMVQVIKEESGESIPVFDDDDVEFYAVPAAANGVGETKIQEHNMELRTDAHSAGMQDALNFLSYKCGLGKDRYNFADGQVKTATEVISEKSDLFQNLKKHELVLEEALRVMVLAIADLESFTSELDITINFDDSIIQDTAAERMQFLQEITNGIRQKWEYRVEFFGEDEETAKEMTTGINNPDPFGLNDA